MANSSDDLHVSGHCYCGGVTFDVHIPAGSKPIFTAYCHCDSCRRAHAAPLYHVVIVDEPMLRVTTGESLLNEYAKSEGKLVRAFCRRCGSRVLNRHPSWRPEGFVPVSFFPNLLDEDIQRALPEVLRPNKHNAPEESVLDAALLQRILSHD